MLDPGREVLYDYLNKKSFDLLKQKAKLRGYKNMRAEPTPLTGGLVTNMGGVSLRDQCLLLTDWPPERQIKVQTF